LAGGLLAAGTTPKPRPEDYPAHAAAGILRIGADYTVHSFSARGRTFVADNYLVVEVAIYGPPRADLMVSTSRLTLRVNGRKQLLYSQAPQFVAASFKYPDWERTRRLEAQAGPVILGRPVPVERFPGDPTARRRVPPRAPEPPDRSGAGKTPEPTADEVVVETGLPEGTQRLPVSGYIYFAHKGKVKSVELIYDGPEGRAVLRLL
jgi:hypothetical protein